MSKVKHRKVEFYDLGDHYEEDGSYEDYYPDRPVDADQIYLQQQELEDYPMYSNQNQMQYDQYYEEDSMDDNQQYPGEFSNREHAQQIYAERTQSKVS